MSIRLRTYTLADRVGLIQTIDVVCAGRVWMSTRHFEPTPAWTHALDNPGCPRHLLLVAENRQVIGWCRLLAEVESRATIELGIGLLPEYRGRGIGSMLVRSALTWAKATCYRRVILVVHSDNRIARHVFERCGFAYGAADRDWLSMACDLRAPGRVTRECPTTAQGLHPMGSA